MKQTDSQYERLRSIVQSFPNITVAVLADRSLINLSMARFPGFRVRPRCSFSSIARAPLSGGGGNAVMNLADLKVMCFRSGVVSAMMSRAIAASVLSGEENIVERVNRLKDHTITDKTRILAGMPHSSPAAGGGFNRETGAAQREPRAIWNLESPPCANMPRPLTPCSFPTDVYRRGDSPLAHLYPLQGRARSHPRHPRLALPPA